MDTSYLIIGTLIIALISMVVIPVMPKRIKSIAAFFLVLVTAILTSIPAIQVLCFQTGFQFEFSLSYPMSGVLVAIDPLSAWFILLINLTCLNGGLYGIGYMKPYIFRKSKTNLHWISFVVLQVSMLWICMLQHGLAFLIAWEIMSVSAFLLVMFDHEKRETFNAGLNYLVQTHLGVLFLTIGFIWLYGTEGTFNFSALGSFFKTHNPICLFLFLFVGFSFKIGFIPMHTWLPLAHPAAPAHISAVMSGMIVKMGIYGILRVVTFLKTDWLIIGETLLILSLMTSFFGILSAAVHRDYKKMLAFCTIENMGIIGMAIGIALIGKGIGNSFITFIGFSAALIHILNHSLYKSLLFFTAGNIYQQTHTRNMENLGGLAKRMPLTTMAFLCGSLAIGGLPPFNGFISKFLIYSGLLEGIKASNVGFNLLMILSIAILAIVGGISLLSFTKSFGTIFLGIPRSPLVRQPREVSIIMRVPLLIIIALMLIIGIFPNYLLILITPVVEVFVPHQNSFGALSILSPPLLMVGRMSFLLIGGILILYLVRSLNAKRRESVYGETWRCGYTVPNSKMQYTGKSYSKTLAKMFSFLILEKTEFKEIKVSEIFPPEKGYSSSYLDLFETYIISPLNKRLLRLMNYFSFIHNGQVQRYVLYGLLFIIFFITIDFFNLL